MFDNEDRQYFARRAADARRRAEEALDPAVKKRHLEFAEEYERRAAGEEPRMLINRPPEFGERGKKGGPKAA